MIYIALSEIKIEIAEQYLNNIANGIFNRIKAVEEIHPTVKNKHSYAYKLWREKDFKLYLAERVKEVQADKCKFKELSDAALVRTREALGLAERTIVGFSSKSCCFETTKGIFPDSKEALGFAEVFKKFSNIAIDGEDLKNILAEEESVRKDKEFTHKKKVDNKKLKLEGDKLGVEVEKLELAKDKAKKDKNKRLGVIKMVDK